MERGREPPTRLLVLVSIVIDTRSVQRDSIFWFKVSEVLVHSGFTPLLLDLCREKAFSQWSGSERVMKEGLDSIVPLRAAYNHLSPLTGPITKAFHHFQQYQAEDLNQ